MNQQEASELAAQFAARVTKGEPEESREDCATYAHVGFMQGWAYAQAEYRRKAELLSHVNTELDALRS